MTNSGALFITALVFAGLGWWVLAAVAFIFSFIAAHA